MPVGKLASDDDARLASHDLAVSLQSVCGRMKKDGGRLRHRRLRKTTDCRVRDRGTECAGQPGQCSKRGQRSAATHRLRRTEAEAGRVRRPELFVERAGALGGMRTSGVLCSRCRDGGRGRSMERVVSVASEAAGQQEEPERRHRQHTHANVVLLNLDEAHLEHPVEKVASPLLELPARLAAEGHVLVLGPVGQLVEHVARGLLEQIRQAKLFSQGERGERPAGCVGREEGREDGQETRDLILWLGRPGKGETSRGRRTTTSADDPSEAGREQTDEGGGESNKGLFQVSIWRVRRGDGDRGARATHAGRGPGARALRLSSDDGAP